MNKWKGDGSEGGEKLCLVPFSGSATEDEDSVSFINWKSRGEHHKTLNLANREKDGVVRVPFSPRLSAEPPAVSCCPAAACSDSDACPSSDL